jgi:hypothetical protein
MLPGARLWKYPQTGGRPHVFPELTRQVVEQVVCEQDVIAPSEVVRRGNEKPAAPQAPVTNSSFAHLSFDSDCLRAIRGDEI